MARKQPTASQRQLLESQVSQLATLVQDLAPRAQVEMTFEQYEDEDAHIYIGFDHRVGHFRPLKIMAGVVKHHVPQMFRCFLLGT